MKYSTLFFFLSLTFYYYGQSGKNSGDGILSGKIVDKIDPRYLPGITPKQTRNKIVRLYARKEGIQSIKIDDQKYYFNKRVK